jgi:hypothetical protein
MPIDFFEEEIRKVQERFNQTFGMLNVYDLKSRQSTILAICSLTLIAGRIKQAKNKDDKKEDIKQFMRNRTILNDVFNQIKTYQEERRNYASSNTNSRNYST